MSTSTTTKPPRVAFTDEYIQRSAARLASKVSASDSGCMEWTGHLSPKGYGDLVLFESGIRLSKRAHRFAWELANGPIPEGQFVCHSCDNPKCCNVDRLFLGSAADNNADMDAKGRRGIGGPALINAGRTTCVSGHPFTPENTRIRPNGSRYCRACGRIRASERRRSQ